jgi:hypothetical protein
MCCIVPKVDLSLIYQIKKQQKIDFMKKLLVNIQIVAMLALIPAMVVAYLHSNDSKLDQEERTEIVRKGTNMTDAGSIIHLVKSF